MQASGKTYPYSSWITISLLLFAVLVNGCSRNSSPQKNFESKDLIKEETPKQDSISTKDKKMSSVESKSVTEITFEKQVIFGSTEEEIIGTIGQVTVDRKNRVFISDMSQMTIHVFGPEGEYITKLGQEGRGPGEFGTISFNTTMLTDSERLYVTDTFGYFPHRAQVFSLEDLSFSHTMKLMAENKDDFEDLDGYSPMQLYPRNDTDFLVAYHRSPNEYKDSKSSIRYFIQDSTGMIISGTIFDQPDRKYLTYLKTDTPSPYYAIHSFPFFGKSLFEISERGEVFTALTEEFKIDVFSQDGKHKRTIQHAIKKQSLNLNKLMDHYENTNYMSQLGEDVVPKMLKNAEDLPETWPVLESMFLDDEERIWVSTVVENKQVYEWWVLEETGELITKFEWSRNEPIEVIKNGYIYTRQTDNETGIERIIKYQISFGES